MVRHVKALYQCDECRLLYPDRSWAQRCEDWCRVHRSCNLGITAHAIKP